jgi:hypothetical protein
MAKDGIQLVSVTNHFKFQAPVVNINLLNFFRVLQVSTIQ